MELHSENILLFDGRRKLTAVFAPRHRSLNHRGSKRMREVNKRIRSDSAQQTRAFPHASEFHPTCGDFTAAGNARICQEKPQRPRTPEPPRCAQTSTACPRKCRETELAASIACSNRRRATRSRSAAAVAAKWPTPGSTILSALCHDSGSAGHDRFAPRQSNAFFTEFRLPAP